MRLLRPALLALLLALPGTVRAEEWVAVRPGIMCNSADALRQLTLPSGDSRTHLPPVRPADQALATGGGCIDIPLGARVRIEQKFNNTAIATYPPGGNQRLVIPSHDFQDASPQADATTPAPGIPPARPDPQSGYAPRQRIPVGTGGLTLVLLEDSRIDARLRGEMWHAYSDPADATTDPAVLRTFRNKPPLPARVQLISPDGHVAEQTLERPLAEIKPSGLRSLPYPTFFLTTDYSIGFGSYAGPFTQLLAPTQTALAPMKSTDAHGASAALVLMSTLKADWKAVPARPGGEDVIYSVNCAPNDKIDFLTTYRTYRYHDGGWKLASRTREEFWEAESFPAPHLFP